ncbi:ATP-dependent Zn protease [Limnofasciculus baicalensis]|uniref:ATP-dependent Zn protease n=1 Tax=Limnofasciculus baicalensis BBK-W-15 TaxID=2699891 RepID=A0AAE3KNY3_9CYAN|nr:ATP-dependent Zn protease [Limnofasciculus baicalensis]MCP2729148.1 ATP-dependent Zn protease [Limnofasciculus baicalensis BBK-W-15]
MEQTALNLIAIGIFGMTLSVLLGPLLNISPIIPAAATFSILGLATLDNFNFQGKGGTLLLDWLAGTKSEHRDRILYHEAGHFLVAYILGIPITGYTLTAWEALKQGQQGLGGVTFDTAQLSPNALNPGEIRLTLDRFCVVWMAGIAAETLVYGNAEGGKEDRVQLRNALISFGYSATDYPVKERWGILQAQTMLEENKAAYEALVAAMKERASVVDCDRIIQEYSHNSPLTPNP